MKKMKLEKKSIKNFWKVALVASVTLAFMLQGSAVFANIEYGNTLGDIGTRPTTIVSILPSAQTVEKGETFTISVYVEPAEDIIGVVVDYLYFDQTLIQANSVTEGDLFDPHVTFFNGGTVDNVAGMITDVYGLTVPVINVTEFGTFCTIEFTAQQNLGTSALNLEDVAVSNATGNPASVTLSDGEVTVEGPAWSATLNFNEPSGESDYAVFGEADDANDGPPADSYDEPKPPTSIPPYIRVRFDDNLPEPYDLLWKDYRRYPDTDKVWDLYVMWVPSDSSSSVITISWNIGEIISSEYASIVLYDYDNSATVAEMTSGSVYEYDTPAMTTHHFQIIATNNQPDTPSNPDPEDGETDVSINVDLSWIGGDQDDGDIVTYDVYFGTTSPPPKIVSEQSSTSFDPGTLTYDATYYWQIVAWDNHDVSNAGPIWSFTTESSDTNGGNGGNGGNGEGITNLPPVADASAGEPYQGFAYSEILFNGTLSYDSDDDGYIASWHWNFGDGTNGTGEITTHIYFNPGIYTISLTVTDNEDAEDIDETTVVISQPNNPPIAPTIDGVISGDKDTEYTYTAVSTDLDGDNISYIFDWGDDTENTKTEFFSNNTIVNTTHTWTSAGVYMLKVSAEDENSVMSGMTKMMVLIDVEVEFIDDVINGYLIDYGKDGTFDVFYNNLTGDETVVERQNGSYLIDIDGDGNWEYIYDPAAGVTVYQNEKQQEKEKSTSGFELIIVVCAIAVFLFWKRKRRDVY